MHWEDFHHLKSGLFKLNMAVSCLTYAGQWAKQSEEMIKMQTEISQDSYMRASQWNVQVVAVCSLGTYASERSKGQGGQIWPLRLEGGSAVCEMGGSNHHDYNRTEFPQGPYMWEDAGWNIGQPYGYAVMMNDITVEVYNVHPSS